MMGFFMFVFAAVLGILVLVGGLQWLEFRRDRRRSVDAGADSDVRVDRLESALGTVEARLDELQEQQRFLERLLAERPERPSLPRGGERAREDAEDAGGSILFDTEPSEEGR